MPTKKDLLREAANAGLCCFWKLNKPELLEIVNLAANKQSIPERYLGKRKIGDICARNDECRTRRCEKNKCVSSKYKEKVQVIKEPAPIVPPPVVPIAPVLPPAVPKQKSSKAKGSKAPKKHSEPKKTSPKPVQDGTKAKTSSPKQSNHLHKKTCGSMLCNYF